MQNVQGAVRWATVPIMRCCWDSLSQQLKRRPVQLFVVFRKCVRLCVCKCVRTCARVCARLCVCELGGLLCSYLFNGNANNLCYSSSSPAILVLHAALLYLYESARLCFVCFSLRIVHIISPLISTTSACARSACNSLCRHSLHNRSHPAR